MSEIIYKCKARLITVSYDVEQVQKSGLGRAAVGGLLFGRAGAVVGAVTARPKTKKTPNFNDGGMGELTIYDDNFTFVRDDDNAQLSIPLEYVFRFTPFKTTIDVNLNNWTMRKLDEFDPLAKKLKQFVDSEARFRVDKKDGIELRKVLKQYKKSIKKDKTNPWRSISLG